MRVAFGPLDFCLWSESWVLGKISSSKVIAMVWLIAQCGDGILATSDQFGG